MATNIKKMIKIEGLHTDEMEQREQEKEIAYKGLKFHPDDESSLTHAGETRHESPETLGNIFFQLFFERKIKGYIVSEKELEFESVLQTS
ncbi:uncharacterized protein LOC122505820 isoform X2 [Leptopilina heterotoma]|uniref:uncharacterized protein LOC122505820 isoform X2 n=1 Tax=Leptopilina heterotoma TaxID=63436 RepID=UPI001CAA141A|nr:uncharacterized protein LOC122505820 isoform X2 [Leptopilina heterotoma]